MWFHKKYFFLIRFRFLWFFLLQFIESVFNLGFHIYGFKQKNKSPQMDFNNNSLVWNNKKLKFFPIILKSESRF